MLGLAVLLKRKRRFCALYFSVPL